MFLIVVKICFNFEDQFLIHFGQMLVKIDDDDHVFALHDHRSGACPVQLPIRLIPNVKELSQHGPHAAREREQQCLEERGHRCQHKLVMVGELL